MEWKMELIQEAESKALYEKCKYKVKLWEHTFKKENGRIPSKLDIREADKDIRDAYRTYFQLKLKAVEESFIDVDGFNSDDETSNGVQVNNTDTATETEQNVEVEHILETKDEKEDLINTPKTWGAHLNNKPSETKSSSKKNVFNINSSFTQKLFGGSKFSKRNPRKSLSFTQKKSDSGKDKPLFLSQPSTSTLDNSLQDHQDSEINSVFDQNSKTSSVFDQNPETNSLFDSNLKIVSANTRVLSQPLDLMQSISNNKELRTVDAGWIQRVHQNLSIDESNDSFHLFPVANTSQADFNSDSDIVYSSGDENSCSVLHINKKQKLLNDTLYKTNSENCRNEQKLDFSQAFSNKNVNLLENTANNQNLDIKNQSVKHETSTRSTDTSKPSKSQQSKDSNKEKPKKRIIKKNVKRDNSSSDSKTNLNTRKSERQRRTVVNVTYSSESEVDPFHSDNDSDDPNFNVSHEKVKTISEEDDSEKPKKKRGKSKIIHEKTLTESTNEENEYELEYSVKPRIKSVPRIKSIKKLLKTNNGKTKDADLEEPIVSTIKNKREQLKEKLEKKLATGTLNENFVTINLRKKVFVRGKKGLNYSKYKKQLWKTKKKALYGPDMDMGGCDGGQLICFNCGQTGHFARACKAEKGDALLPKDVKEDCPFPTLEEASQMAKESALAIRKPKIGDKETVENNECEFSDEDDDELLLETLKLEAALDEHEYLDAAHAVKPVYNLNKDGSVMDTPEEVFEVLNKFGHSFFRPGQERAIMRILSGKSTLVTLSTGSGKSLCYQIPAYMYSLHQQCITLVISPLVSLMEDQVTGIPTFLKAACLHTNQTKTQRDKIMDLISKGGLNVLLVSPEAIVAGERSTGFGSLLRKLPPIAFACIDEVHCVSQWSHNFRPSYLMICRVLQDRLGVTTILGLTATATKSTCDSVTQHLKITDGEEGVIQDIPLPRNLHLTVSKDAQRDQALLGLLLSEKFSELKSIIVYCTRRDECERVATYLRTCLKHQRVLESDTKKRKRVDVQAEPYHAGISASRRRTIQKAFMSGELRIVVATVAFGMGINKSDIRAVIHYNMPSNFESYVQEIGRAGRDGLPAYCHLFLDSQGKDGNELRRHIYANSVERHTIRKLLQKIFVPCSCEKTCPRHEVAFSIQETVQAFDIPEENISTLLCYLELHKNKYIQVLSPAYVTCKVISYGGQQQIVKASKDCPPLAMALVVYKERMEKDSNVIEFPVVDIASNIGWDSGICKHKLKNLEWTSVNNQPKRSLLNVQFSNLGFRVLAPGNLSGIDLDEALESLCEHVANQERTALLQLHALDTAVTEFAKKSYRECISQNETNEHDEKLKSKIRQYFESPNPLENLPEVPQQKINVDQIATDVRALVCMYRDNVFTGRAVARIFHGIQSPNYPAVIWGRCKFWRTHINVDFHSLCRIATQEILKMR